MQPFIFLDKVVECTPHQSLVSHFRLSSTAEYLQDHFNGFPVMPGVLILECAKQACAELLKRSGEAGQFRLASVSSVKFGQFVRPGSLLKVNVRKESQDEKGAFECSAVIDLIEDAHGHTDARRSLMADLVLEKI